MAITGLLSPYPKLQFFDDNGLVLSGGLLYSYAAGSTTPLGTYSNADLDPTHANANPVVLDAAGRALVFLANLAYKLVLKTSAGATIWTVDNIQSNQFTGIVLATVTSNHVLSVTDGTDLMVLADPTAGALTVTLYTAVGNAGARILVKKIGSSNNAVTVKANGAETMDGSNTRVLYGTQTWIWVESDGTGWRVIGYGGLQIDSLNAVLNALIVDPTDATPTAVDGSYVTTGAATIYTVPASTFAIVNRLTIFNADTVSNDAQLSIVDSGGSVNAAARIFAGTLLTTRSVVLEGPWFLDTGDYISGVSASATGTDMSVRADVTQLSAQLSGASLLFDDGDALTNAFATYLTATGKTIVEAMTVCNTDTTDRVVTIAIVPSGGSAANAQSIFGATVTAKGSIVIGGPFVLKTGDFIQAKAAVGAVVAFRISAVLMG